MKNKLGFLFVIGFLLISIIAFHVNLTGFLISGCLNSDNGDKYLKGILSYQGLKAEDSCNNNKLVEYFCNSNGIPSVTLNACELGCENGACKKSFNSNFKEVFQIKKGSNILELNEYLGNVIGVLTENEMPILLKSSSIFAKGAKSTYHQYLRFNDLDLKTGTVKLTRDETGKVSDFLGFNDTNYLFEYELEFVGELSSEIINNNLPDIYNKKLNILGGEYEIVDSKVNNNEIELTFSGGAAKDSLNELESKTYTIQGKSYLVKLDLVDKGIAVFDINREKSKSLAKGDIDDVNGVTIAISNILENEAGEAAKDSVSFFINAKSFRLKDDISDDNFRQGAVINGRLSSDAFVKIKGQKKDGEIKIYNIKYRARPKGIKGGDLFISPGKGTKYNLINPDLFLGNWDIFYQGLSENIKKIAGSDIFFNPTGDKYKLTFTNVKGQTYTIPLVSNNNGVLTIGNNENSLYFIEASSSSDFIIKPQDYFVLTSKNDRAGITNILRYSSINIANNQLSLGDLSEGNKEVIFTGTPGVDAVANLPTSGRTYKVFIGPAPNYNLAIDLNGDGNINSNEVKIVTNGGGLLDLGSAQTSASDFNMILSTQSTQFSKRSTDENINIQVQKESNSVNVKVSSQTDLTLESTGQGNKEGLSSFGIKFILREKSGPDELIASYPTSQAEAKVSVVLN